MTYTIRYLLIYLMLKFKHSQISLLLICFLLYTNFSISQNEKTSKSDTLVDDYYGTAAIHYEDRVYSPNIKTVQLHDESFEMSHPIISLGSSEKLKLSFDELDADFKNYSYTFIHCNSKWEPSNLMPTEYMDGFQDNPISNYRYSYNTQQKYVHYYTIFPSSSSNFTKSGNYILKVYENDNPENIIITRRFMVFQNKVTITSKISRVSDVVYSNYNQEVDFKIDHSTYTITNPYSDLKVVITKNNCWNNAKTNLKPLFVKNTELDYELSPEAVFPGGNEFRNVNIKSIRYKSDRISTIVRDSALNHIFLVADEKRSFKRYEFDQDLDGNFIVKIQEGTNSEVEADYCYVHFFLPLDDALTDGNLYIHGAFNGWRCDRENMLHYNEKRFGYEATLYLKQGYYNYEYVFLKDGTSEPDETIIEGTHFETENLYTIYVYHQQRGTYYDQLIGVKRLSSGN